MNQKSAIKKINEKGVLLVFPVNNKPEPASLWSEFFPRSKMRWEWDESGDNRVSDMWFLMKRLSDIKDVVYTKWYQGRATFFSRELFTALLCVLRSKLPLEYGLSPSASLLLETLESDSPLSTKELKRATELQGRDNEPTYTRSMKELFSRFLIVGFGEVEDGAFPSLAVGATKLLYEDLWEESLALDPAKAFRTVEKFMPSGSLMRRTFDRMVGKLPTLEGDESEA